MLRIFPGKLSPEEPSPATRRNVKLVATIEPPIAGVTVYFRVFDVDDPFDDLHGPSAPPDQQIANVDIIDGNTASPDNCRTAARRASPKASACSAGWLK